MNGARSIRALQRENARCRRCLEAGYPIVPPPVFAGRAGQRAYLFGLAPGRVEAERGLPWQGRACRTLRGWLRLDEDEFFAQFYCASLTRCFPGPSASGPRSGALAGAALDVPQPATTSTVAIASPIRVKNIRAAPARCSG